MKKLFFCFVLIALTVSVFTQTPQKMSYQAVIRNASGALVTNHAVGMKISILSGSTSGTVVFAETCNPTPQTNANGLVSIEIGSGIPSVGTFSAINWAGGLYYLKTEIDPSGGSGYTIIGTSQLLSVPYSLFAKTSESLTDNSVTSSKIVDGAVSAGDLASNSVITEKINNSAVTGAKIAQGGATVGQVLKWNGTSWIPSSDAEGAGLTIPWSGTASSTGQNFKIYNSGSGSAIFGESAAGTGVIGMTDGSNTSGVLGLAHALSGVSYGVRGESDSPDAFSGYFLGARFYISGKAGIGIENPTTNLDINGQVRVRGGNPGAGKVLTSDATGLATWQTSAAGPFISAGGITSNVQLTDNFVFGSNTLDNNPSSNNDDFRFFFNKQKGAFRAGYVYGPEWDYANLGQYSAAFGTQNKASATGSFASGTQSIASGYNSSVFGMFNTASSEQSTAIGSSAVASGSVSTAIGYFVNAAAQFSTAIGTYNIGSGSSHAWVPTDPIFEIGIGTGTTRANAVTVLKNGDTGIGTATPSSKLEVTGQVKITGGSPGAGKVLTSDASGLAAWATTELTLPYAKTTSSVSPLISLNNSGSGNGILAVSTSTTGTTGGVIGEAWSTSGSGIIGTAWAVTGINYGVRGKTQSVNGFSGYFDGGKFYISGNTGIGRGDPTYKLDVMGDRIRLLESGTNDWIALRTDGGTNDYLDLSWGGGSLVIQGATTDENIIMNPSMNKVGIRTWTPQYDLDVNGNIRATGSVYFGGTTTSAGTAYSKPDYVFGEDYEILKTEDIELFLKEKNHLPWVTSVEQEKHENGKATDMTRMAFETLESVENLQLQIIRQQKLISDQQAKIYELELRLSKLETSIKTKNDNLIMK